MSTPQQPTNDKSVDLTDNAQVYDRDANAFADESESLFTWLYIGRQALEKGLRLSGILDHIDAATFHALEEGSASGRVAKLLLALGIPAVCIDGVEISPNQVALAQERVPGPNFFVGDIRTVSLEPKHYDLVVRHMVDEHLDNDGLLAASRNALEAMIPGGALVIVVTHPDRMEKTQGATTSGQAVDTFFPWGGKGVNYYRPVTDYKRILEEAGFEVELMEDCEIAPEGEAANPKDFIRYKEQGNTRLLIVARKPKR